MSSPNIYSMNQTQLMAERHQAEMYLREVNRLLKKRQAEDIEHFKLDRAGNPKRIKKLPQPL